MTVLVADGANNSITGTLAETTLKSLTIPAGLLQPNDLLLIEVYLAYVGSANTKNTRLYFGNITQAQAVTIRSSASAEVGRFRAFLNSADSTNVNVNTLPVFGIAAENGTIVTVTPGPLKKTFAVDTTQSQVLKVTGQLSNTGDTINIRGWLVRLLTQGQ